MAALAVTWTVRTGDEPAVRVQLQLQNVEGIAIVGDRRAPLELVRLYGVVIRCELPGTAQGTARYEGTADHHGHMSGTVSPVSGNRPPGSFTARRA